LDGDLLLALLALAEAAVLDLEEGLLDLPEEGLLAAAETERERLEVLARREVHLVREVVRVEGHVLVERLLGLLDDFVPLRLEQRLELLELGLVHGRLPASS